MTVYQREREKTIEEKKRTRTLRARVKTLAAHESRTNARDAEAAAATAAPAAVEEKQHEPHWMEKSKRENELQANHGKNDSLTKTRQHCRRD